MPNIERGEVWLVDLGMAAKARPAVVPSIPILDNERAVYAIVPHTTVLQAGRATGELRLRALPECGRKRAAHTGR